MGGCCCRHVFCRSTAAGNLPGVPAPVRLQLHVFRDQIRGKPMPLSLPATQSHPRTGARCLLAVLLATTTVSGTAQAATEIDLFLPVPVQGKLAVEMQRMIEQYNKDHPATHVTA